MIASIRDDVKSEMLELLHSSSPTGIDIDIPEDKPRRKIFDPSTPAGRVDKVISERIRPGVNSDGGDVELVELTSEGVAIIKMIGACNGCPSSDATLKNAIEKTLLHFCAGDVTEVRQAPTETPTIDSGDVIPAMSSAGMDLPSVITHNHNGLPLDTSLNGRDFPVVSLFARKVDEKMISRIKFGSNVTIPKNSGSSIDVWVNCGDCGAKKRLEDVNELNKDARKNVETVDKVAVIICPACAVIVKEI